MLLPPGYEGVRQIHVGTNTHDIHCRIEERDDLPLFICICLNPPVSFSSRKITEAMKSIFAELQFKPVKKWSGYEFFGMMSPERYLLVLLREI